MLINVFGRYTARRFQQYKLCKNLTSNGGVMILIKSKINVRIKVINGETRLRDWSSFDQCHQKKSHNISGGENNRTKNAAKVGHIKKICFL